MKSMLIHRTAGAIAAVLASVAAVVVIGLSTTHTPTQHLADFDTSPKSSPTSTQ
jgi:hypothetical protein